MKIKINVTFMTFLLFMLSNFSLSFALEGVSNTFYGLGSGYEMFGNPTHPSNSYEFNTFFGANAGYNNTTGYENTFLGYESGVNNINGFYNSFIGFQAGYSSSGIANTYIGHSAGWTNTGSNNTFVGYNAGGDSVGSGNVFIGYDAGRYEGGSNRLYISNSSTDEPLIYGEFDNRLLIVYGSLEIQNLSQSSDKRYKKDIKSIDSALDKILAMNGVSYKWKKEDYKNMGFSDGRHYGFIGQEMEKVLPDIVSEGRDGHKKIAYTEIIPLLVEAIKQQEQTISSLTDRVNDLERKLELRGAIALVDSK